MRIGRGGKRGTTSGRGQKGQKSRAGRRIRPAARDLVLKFPKWRGFRHRPVTPVAFVVRLADLLGKIERTGGVRGSAPVSVTRTSLKAMGLIPFRYRGRVKVLGDIPVRIPIALAKDIEASERATIRITGGGGTAG